MSYKMVTEDYLKIGDELIAKQQEREQEDLRKQRMDDLASKDVFNIVSPETYDFEAAALETDFSEASEGGIDLPNRYAKNLAPMAGYDINTGEKIWDEPDPDGFGKAGMEAVRNGITNTKHGVPSDVYDGYFRLAAHARQNGRSLADIELPIDPQTQRDLTGLVSRTEAYATALSQFQTLNSEPAPQPDPEQRTLTQEDLVADADFMKAAQLLADFKRGPEVERDPLDVAGPEPSDDPNDLVSNTIQDIAFLMSNEVSMAKLATQIKAGDLDTDTAKAYLYALDQYDRVSSFDLDVMQGTGQGVVLSPLAWLTGGGAAVAVKTAGKAAGKYAISNMLRRYIASKVFTTASQRQAATAIAGQAAVGAVAGTVEGGAMMGGQSLTEQQLQIAAGQQYDINWNKAATDASWGAAAGFVLGGAFGGLMTAPVGRGVGNAWSKMVDNYNRTTPQGAFARQRGSISFNKAKNPSISPIIRAMRGEDIGDPSRTMGIPLHPKEFYSRAITNVFGPDGKSGNWTKAYGNKPNKNIDPNDLLEKFNAWQKGDPQKGVPSFSQYELKNMGMYDYLRTKAIAGESVTKREIDNLMYARQPRFNVGIFSFDDPKSIAQGGLPSIDEYRLNEILSSLPEVMNEVRNIPIGVIDEHMGPGTGSAYTWTNPFTQERQVHPFNQFAPELKPEEIISGIQYTIAQDMKNVIGNLPMKTRLRAVEEIEKEILKGNPLDMQSGMYAEMTLGRRNPEFFPNNYRELRIFQPHNGNDPEVIAQDKFGAAYAQLEKSQKEDVDQIIDMTYDPAAYNETAHFPMDVNRLSHARIHDVFDAESGERIMFINELQSDMKNAIMRRAPEKAFTPEDNAVRNQSLIDFIGSLNSVNKGFGDVMNKMVADHDAGEIPFQYVEDAFKKAMINSRNMKPSDVKIANDAFKKMKRQWLNRKEREVYQPTEGWVEGMLAQIFNLAAKDGYKHVAFPSTFKQLQEIEGWDRSIPRSMTASVENFYTERLPNLLKQKKMMKRLGITRIVRNNQIRGDEFDWNSTIADEGVTVYVIDPKKAQATPETPKPLYGALAAPGGVTFLGGEENE